MKVLPSLAENDLTRLNSAVHQDGSRRRVGELLRLSSTKAKAMLLVRGALVTTRSVPYHSHNLTKPRGRSKRASPHRLLTTATAYSNRPCV